MKKIIASTAVAAAIASGIALAAPANAGTQSGWDRDHSWLKIGYQGAVVPNNTGGHNFNHAGCPGLNDLYQCDKLHFGVGREFLASPNRVVGGYWAEFYPKTGRLVSGTW